MMSKIVTMIYFGGSKLWETKELHGDEVGYHIQRGVGEQGSPHDTARIWNESTTFVVPLHGLVSIEVTERKKE